MWPESLSEFWCEFFVTSDISLVGWNFTKVWTVVGYTTEATACFVAMLLLWDREILPSQFILSMPLLCWRCSDRPTGRRLYVSSSVYLSCFTWPPYHQVLATLPLPESRTFSPQIAKICKLSAFHQGWTHWESPVLLQVPPPCPFSPPPTCISFLLLRYSGHRVLQKRSRELNFASWFWRLSCFGPLVREAYMVGTCYIFSQETMREETGLMAPFEGIFLKDLKLSR